MPQCPQCSKPLASLARQCPSCRADLDLLVDYVNGLQSSLYQAKQLTLEGKLGAAMWAYLEVLEVDPDNAEAREQVGQIATAVRQFDRTLPGRRWSQGLTGSGDANGPGAWVKALTIGLVVVFAFSLGFMVARSIGMEGPATPVVEPTKKDVVKERKPGERLDGK
jgi:hypothetical protein